MTLTAGNLFRAFIWALVGSIVLGVLLFPYGGENGTAGLSFAVWHAIAIYILAAILWFYPTERPPFFKRFLGYQGIESTLIFVLIIEAGFVGIALAYAILGWIVDALGWWTGLVGSVWGAAHFIVSAGLLATAYYRSRQREEPGQWYTAPIALILLLFLVPLAYEGKLLG
ncbi:MAG: hypothetical protein RID91_20240 [Azospirillaceae bacterium]